MTTLKWHQPKDQTFQAGLDRGVIYPENGDPIPWNGLISVEDSGESEVKELYLDGQKYLSLVSARDWAGKLEAYTFPDEFSDMVGISGAGDGLYFDSQLPARFSLSYRTIIAAPNHSEVPHYRIHVIYQALASLGAFTHATLSDSGAEPIPFEFELTAVPKLVPGHRPTAHIIIDTREIDATTLGTLEGMLYGNGFRDPELPTIEELLDLLTFSGPIVIHDNGDGTWTAEGSNRYIKVTDDGYFEISNVFATWLDEYTYEFGDGTTLRVPWRVKIDTDGEPYFVREDGDSNLAVDTDGIPYLAPGEDDVSIFIDTDSVPYYDGSDDLAAPEPTDPDGGDPDDEDEPIMDGGTA